MGRKAYEIGIILYVLSLIGCVSQHPHLENEPSYRPVPVRIFVQQDIVNNACTQVKSEKIIFEELMWAEQFCPELNLRFNILDWYYFNNIDNIEEHELSAHYSDSVNIFYYFPTMNGVAGHADFPWEFPAAIKIYGAEYDPKLLTHEFYHGFSLKHIHKSSLDTCSDDGCADTEDINLLINEMNNYPNIMTYSRSDYYFITRQQIERVKLWYKIRFIYKVYGPELTNPINYELIN